MHRNFVHGISLQNNLLCCGKPPHHSVSPPRSSIQSRFRRPPLSSHTTHGPVLGQEQLQRLLAGSVRLGHGFKIFGRLINSASSPPHGIFPSAIVSGHSLFFHNDRIVVRHKASGLSAFIVKRMLSSPLLPRTARRTLHEYIEQKLAGTYGHGLLSRRMFHVRIGRAAPALPRDEKDVEDAQPSGFRRRHKH